MALSAGSPLCAATWAPVLALVEEVSAKDLKVGGEAGGGFRGNSPQGCEFGTGSPPDMPPGTSLLCRPPELTTGQVSPLGLLPGSQCWPSCPCLSPCCPPWPRRCALSLLTLESSSLPLQAPPSSHFGHCLPQPHSSPAPSSPLLPCGPSAFPFPPSKLHSPLTPCFPVISSRRPFLS